MYDEFPQYSRGKKEMCMVNSIKGAPKGLKPANLENYYYQTCT